MRTEKANLTFSISIYLLSPAQYYNPTSAKDVKEFLPMFRLHQDSNQERAARLTCTTDVNSNRIDVQLPSLSNKLVLPLFLVVVELLLLLLLLWSRKELDLEHGNETCCSDDDLIMILRDMVLSPCSSTHLLFLFVAILLCDIVF
jgi:hypothetical protein